MTRDTRYDAYIAILIQNMMQYRQRLNPLQVWIGFNTAHFNGKRIIPRPDIQIIEDYFKANNVVEDYLK
jgi:hypothetical protein